MSVFESKHVKSTMIDNKVRGVVPHGNNLEEDCDIVVIPAANHVVPVLPVPVHRILAPVLRKNTYLNHDAWLVAQEGKGLTDPNTQGELVTSIGWQHIFWTDQMLKLAIKAHLRNPDLSYTKRDEDKWGEYTLFTVDLPNRQVNHPVVPHWVDPIHLNTIWNSYCTAFCVENFGSGNNQDPQVAPALAVMRQLVTITVDNTNGSGTITRQS